jgi:hypothetical protein
MTPTDLQAIADAVIRRARVQGSVGDDEIREELARAGESEDLWKDVLALARPSLRHHDGRHHYVPADGTRHPQEQAQQRVHEVVQELLQQHRAARSVERREQDRVDFIQPVQVRVEDGRTFTLLSRDLSPSGIRLVGTRRLLGQKVRVQVARPGGGSPWAFLVRILWTCALGDDLFENGGMFLETETAEPQTNPEG